jgi:hypothetical protein
MFGIFCGGGRAAQGLVAASLCSSTLSINPVQELIEWRVSYPAHDLCAALTLAHHIARTTPHLPARHVPRGLETNLRPLAKARLQLRIGIVILVAAVQRVPDELVAVLEQVGAELATRAREVMEGV